VELVRVELTQWAGEGGLTRWRKGEERGNREIDSGKSHGFCYKKSGWHCVWGFF
jgi:hypothetical protein